jgi:hypothetical protein
MRRKIRNEFIPRHGHRGLFGNRWTAAHESKGWVVMIGILLFTYLGRQWYLNFKKHGSIFTINGGNYLRHIFYVEIGELVGVVGAIYLFSFTAYGMQKLMIRWNLRVTGRAIMHGIQHILMIAMLATVTIYLLYRRYDVSITYRFTIGAEALVMYMKMVSYLGTNNYLWILSRSKKGGDNSATAESSHSSQTRLLGRMFGRKSVVYAYQPLSREEIEKLSISEIETLLLNRGICLDDNCFGSGSILGGHIIPDSPRTREHAARRLLEELVELDEYRKCVYPSNISLKNFAEFTVTPVIVYEPRYPKTNSVSVLTIIEKLLILFGMVLFSWSLFEHYIIPRILDIIDHPGSGDFSVVIDAMIDMIIPLQLFVVMGFYMSFECILGGNAELVKLADREFYSDWWNSTSFEEFSRKWNKPVHEFLLRHVHIESQVSLGLGRGLSTIVTFIYSILAHEILLLNMFGIFRPYLGVLSLFQIPLWPLMRSHFITNKLFGNVIFWASLMVAWPLILVLYCRDYCKEDPRNCRIDI